MFELLFQVVGEFVLQVIVEALAELGLHAMAEPFNRPPRPWLAAIGYFLFGVVFGLLSLMLAPSYLVTDKSLRLVNLIITPLVVGACMSAMGAWRARRGQVVLRIDRFAYGYLFALSFAIVRFGLAE